MKTINIKTKENGKFGNTEIVVAIKEQCPECAAVIADIEADFHQGFLTEEECQNLIIGHVTEYHEELNFKTL